MKTFDLELLDATHTERIGGVSSFVGEDASGGFGILAGHARLITTLVFGLARFRCGDEPWHYLALPGGVLRFADGQLSIGCRRYLMDDDYARISRLLNEQLLAEEDQLRSLKESLHRMEEEVFRRLWEMGRKR
jgi:F-type H+-transporting ATPase subunit epsilon